MNLSTSISSQDQGGAPQRGRVPSLHSSTIAPSFVTGKSEDILDVALRHWTESKEHALKQLGTRFRELTDTILPDQETSGPQTGPQKPEQSNKDVATDLQPYINGLLDLTRVDYVAAISDVEDLDICAKVLYFFCKTLLDYDFVDFRRRAPVQSQLDELNGLVFDVRSCIDSVSSTSLDVQRVQAAVIEVAAYYLTFYVDLVHFVRGNQASVELALKRWDGEFGSRISKFLEGITGQIKRLKDIGDSHLSLPTRHHNSSNSNEDISSEETTISYPQKCHYLPNPKITNFFGRKKESSSLHSALDHNSDDVRHRAVCICGPGGIGKTQLALEYAYSRKDQVDFILWINSESQVEIDRSFSAVSLELRLAVAEDGSRQTHHKRLVLDYLQNSDQDFLVIFDNVEDFDDIRKQCWPLSPHSSVLVTARAEIVAVDMVHCIEVPNLDETESLELLLAILAKDSYSKTDRNAAKKLAEDLGGMPLALAIMAMNIRSSKKSLTNFLPWYEGHTAKIHKKVSAKASLQPYYLHSLHECFKTSFVRLREESQEGYELFRIACTLGAEALPSVLFQGQDSEDLPLSLKFCQDEWDFEQAIEALINRALVRVNEQDENRQIFVHRVIQVEFNNTLSSDELQANFLAAGKLLFHKFPKLVNGLSFRKEWTECATYAGHISALCKHYRSDLYKPEPGSNVDEIVQCLAGCAWYLRETSDFADCLDTLDVAFKLCTEKKSLLYASLLNTAGIIATRQNRIENGYLFHRECLEIRKALLEEDHEEIANCHNNIGNTYLSDCQYDEAIKAYHEAIRIDKLQPEAEAKKILNIRYSNIAEAYMMKGDYGQMQKYLDISRKLAIDEFGKDTFYDADVDWIIGHKHYYDGELEKARELYTRALEVNKKENPDSMTTNAILYKLGSISFELGEVDKAINELRDALKLADANKKEQGNDGEIARVKRRLADALYQVDGCEAEAKQLHKEAESSRLAIQSSVPCVLPDIESSYDLLLAYYYRGRHLGNGKSKNYSI
ncbi:tetratricopeptide-like helical [Fusarium phyllophilum]|uniref:Tetratricopeptide-like helical n=1 Tax=Fusarium phyllophilum TaxID=47803 RepID=A0A8H5IJ61_9HYPO|nr:tetratricopeptide-like helical [Fusarium phyllophilum]